MLILTNVFYHLLPEIVVAITACATLLTGVCTQWSRAQLTGMSVLGLLFAVALLVVHPAGAVSLFSGQWVVNHTLLIVKAVLLLMVVLVMIYSHVSAYYERECLPEYLALLGIVSLGMMVMCSASHLLVMFLGLELMSLPLYALVGLPQSRKPTEAALKYFMTGAIASGLLLYGCSFLYGATGVLEYQAIAQMVATLGQGGFLPYACVFILAGLLFKLGTVPFHMWVPDVYEGANMPTTMLLATATKLAVITMLLRLLFVALPDLVTTWQPLVLIVGLSSVALGNIVAVVQTKIRRLLAYSSIAHMGYLLLGVFVATQAGYQAVLFYALTYVFTTAVAFGVLTVVQHRQGEIEEISSLRGLNSVYPWQAFVLLLACFSMAGVPPLLGFMGKLALFKVLIESHYTVIATIAITFAIIGAYYYIRIIQAMYFEEAEEGTLLLSATGGVKLCVILSGLTLLLLGLLPSGVLSLL